MPAVALARLGHVHKVHLPLACIKLIFLIHLRTPFSTSKVRGQLQP